jgi:hypothetical protein
VLEGQVVQCGCVGGEEAGGCVRREFGEGLRGVSLEKNVVVG